MKRKDKLQELRGIPKEELLLKIKALKEELSKLNVQRYSGRVDKPHMFLSVRKDIARVNTILNSAGNVRPPVGKKEISNEAGEKKVQA